jgi:hypothetical protein
MAEHPILISQSFAALKVQDLAACCSNAPCLTVVYLVSCSVELYSASVTQHSVGKPRMEQFP